MKRAPSCAWGPRGERSVTVGETPRLRVAPLPRSVSQQLSLSSSRRRHRCDPVVSCLLQWTRTLLRLADHTPPAFPTLRLFDLDSLCRLVRNDIWLRVQSFVLVSGNGWFVGDHFAPGHLTGHPQFGKTLAEARSHV